MAELKRIDEEVPTAELASVAFPAKEPEGPKLVKGPSSYYQKDGEDEKEVGQMMLWAAK